MNRYMERSARARRAKAKKKDTLDILRADRTKTGDKLIAPEDYERHAAEVRQARDESLRKWQQKFDSKEVSA